MNILEFILKFPDEGACRLKFKEQRDQIGIVCGKCNCKERYWLENKLCYQCKDCHRRIYLRSGTLMQSSKLPFRYWFVTMHLLTCTRKFFSTEELRRQLGHKRYQLLGKWQTNFLMLWVSAIMSINLQGNWN